MVPGIHGTTFGGNQLAMAVANAVLDVMLEPDFLPHVERPGRLLRGQLEDLATRFPHVIAEIRGAGLLLGLQVVVTNTDLVARLRRPDERSLGNECLSQIRSRWSP